MTKSNPLWALVDAANHIHRDYNAAGATKALGLFKRTIAGLRKLSSPDLVAICFDSPKRWRQSIEPSYKADRGESDPEIRKIFDLVREWCITEGIDVVESEGFEADDCIATLTRIARSSGGRVLIASSDKDLRQLLESGTVTALTGYKREGSELVQRRWMTAAMVREDFGIDPDQWVDYQTMIGDKTDNVIGAHGIGPAAARRVLRACRSLDQYYDNPWPANLTAHQMAALEKFRGRYRTVRRLVQLRADVPLAAAWHEMGV